MVLSAESKVLLPAAVSLCAAVQKYASTQLELNPTGPPTLCVYDTRRFRF